MPISIFNPPCPHADPVNGQSPRLPASGQGACGNCICVPRYYLLKAGDFAPPTTGYPAVFAGTRVLKRNIPAYIRNDGFPEPCQWFDIPPFPPGGLLVGGNSYPYGWYLYNNGPVTGFNTGWILRAAGQSYVGGAPPQDTAFYTLQAPGHGTSSFNCLKPTTFWQDSNYGSVQAFTNLPASIIIQPFWP
ncbi:MAG: hypothetical protein KGL39_22530 [Patescibacteria group bacterium]|nr:hypothetical protein [Patescibacteria group bacterium]